MLKANDLRIGNLVIYDGMELPVQSIISPKPDVLERYNNKWCIEVGTSETMIVAIDEIKPIHISSKMVDEIWCKRKNKKDDLVFSETINSKKRHIIVGDEYYIRCDYLHQLQNAYYIATGKELECVKVAL